MKKSSKNSRLPLSISPFTIIIFFIISHSSLSQAHAINTRQNLEISIGIGSPPPEETPVCPEPIPPPPPPPEECPPPPHPPPPPPPPKHHPPPPPSPPPPHPPPPPPSPPPPRPPPPPPPPTPRPPKPPPSPPDLPPELQRAVKVIQRFRKTIVDDPLHITDTWNGRICFDKTKYKGFICDTTVNDGKIRVALVNFNNFKFAGSRKQPLVLQNFLDGLSDIIVFHSNSNNFSGGVPPGINTVTSLFELDLSNNKLHGPFPPQVLTATNLTFLDLRFNYLTGTVPPAVFTLDLDVLFLNNNKFTGAIPAALGKTPSLYVTLANNKFTGAIPGSIGQASNTLLEILLLGNQLTGCLPYQIGFLKKTTLFDASANGITGPIPHSFGCLKSMNYLNIARNQLYGAVPEALCRIKELVQLTLSYNYITEVGPDCRKLIRSKKLDLSMNCVLDLPNQRSKETCAAFFLKRQSCPDPESFNKVPCRVEPESESDSDPEYQGDLGRKLLMDQPRTYAALELHA